MKIKPGQIILFDIDKTLHDNEKFQKLYQAKAFKYLKINEEKWNAARLDYDESLPESRYSHSGKMLKHVSENLNVDIKKLRLAHYATENYQLALFQEVKEVLEKLKKTHKLGLFSEGYRDHQLRKIKKGGLLDLFDPSYHFILFNKRTKNVIDKLPKNAVIIDDKPAVIEVLLKRPDLQVIWLNRVDLKKHPKAYTIHSLKELLLLV